MIAGIHTWGRRRDAGVGFFGARGLTDVGGEFGVLGEECLYFLDGSFVQVHKNSLLLNARRVAGKIQGQQRPTSQSQAAQGLVNVDQVPVLPNNSSCASP